MRPLEAGPGPVPGAALAPAPGPGPNTPLPIADGGRLGSPDDAPSSCSLLSCGQQLHIITIPAAEKEEGEVEKKRGGDSLSLSMAC